MRKTALAGSPSASPGADAADGVVVVFPCDRGTSTADPWAYLGPSCVLALGDSLARCKHTTISVAWAVLHPVLKMRALDTAFSHLAKLPSGNPGYPIFAPVSLLLPGVGRVRRGHSHTEEQRLLVPVTRGRIPSRPSSPPGCNLPPALRAWRSHNGRDPCTRSQGPVRAACRETSLPGRQERVDDFARRALRFRGEEAGRRGFVILGETGVRLAGSDPHRGRPGLPGGPEAYLSAWQRVLLA